MNIFCNFRWKFVWLIFLKFKKKSFSVQLKTATKNSKWFSLKFKPKEKYLFHDRPHSTIQKNVHNFFFPGCIDRSWNINSHMQWGFFCPLRKQRLDPPLILDNMEASCASPSHSSRTLCFSGWSAVAITHIIDSQKFRN